MKKFVILVFAAALCVSALSGCAGAGAGPKGAIHITGPIEGGKHGWPFGAYFGDISKIGYVEEEFFIEGSAAHYNLTSEWTTDGKWTLEKGDASQYKTRILVWRPADAEKFNGTIVVEWSNVTFGYDFPFVDFQCMSDLTDLGFAYALVTAQPIGVNGFQNNSQGLIPWDSGRYGTLSIPDDGISYDVFTQAGKALGPNRKSLTTGADPMNGFTVKKLIATGGSQGGIRLLSYANGVQQTENVYNALLLAMGSGQAIDFKADIAEDTSAVANSTPAEALAARALSDSRRLRPVQVRNDLSVPVMVFNSEAESDWAFDARQPETDKYRHWEIAGARHGSTKKMHFASLKSDRDGLTFNVTNNPSSFLFTEADWQPAMAAAFWHISNWIDGGNPPPSIPPIEIVKIDDVIQTSRDRYGNAIGGVRLPAIEAPIAHLVIATRARMRAEGLRGQYTIPFSTAYLKQLYPTHNDYVIKVTEAVNKAKAAGVMLQHAAADYIKQAEAASIPEIAYPDSVRALLRF